MNFGSATAVDVYEYPLCGSPISTGISYPRAKRDVLDRYVQDRVCGTWELLADAVYPGGSTAI